MKAEMKSGEAMGRAGVLLAHVESLRERKGHTIIVIKMSVVHKDSRGGRG